MSTKEEPSPPPPTCTRCGLPTDDRLGDVVVCDACYAIAGSCCAEFEPEETEP